MCKERGYPYSPARTLARAYLTGLSALRDLLRGRATGRLRDVYEKTQGMWTEAQEEWEKSKRDGDPDFSKITNREKHMRANFLKMFWETTARHGNREHRRVQNERKGKIGPLNRLLNMAGAQMRNFAMTKFPFPLPEVLGREGKTAVYGYKGDETYPQVQVTHATLPEMDFVDMIRAHVYELCRKCFMNDVPMRETRSYVNLLIYRLAPFLEYLYTSGESGRWGFKRKRKKQAGEELPDADSILRRIVREIEAFYGARNGRPRTVTEQVGGEHEPLGVSLFLDESFRLRELDDEQRTGEMWGAYLRDLCDRGILRDRDAHWLQAEAVKRARWYGIRLHQILTMGLLQPYNARSVISEGDKFAQIGDDFLVMAELPLKTNLGEGRADLIIFRRHLRVDPRNRKETPVWQPIAVFDIKSKTAFDWWIEKERRKSKKHGTIMVPRIQLKRRGFIEDEWRRVIAQTADKDEKKQINAYAGGLRAEYVRLTGDESAPLPVTGTIIVDVSQDGGAIQRGLFRLINSLFRDYLGDLTPRVGEKLVVNLDEYTKTPLRLSLIVHGVDYRQRKMLEEQGEPVSQNNPDYGLNTESNLIFYCSVPSGSRSGPSAAWIAQYWHGLEYIQSLCERENIGRVVWIDVSGDFHAGRLARTRLRLEEHRPPIQQFFNRVEIVDASHAFQSFLFMGGRMPTLKSILTGLQDVSSDSMIVISGWEMLESITPDRLHSALHECKRHLVEDLTERQGSSLWFERPRGGEASSSIYQRKKVIPFSNHSPFYGRVKAVIWNLPTRPYATGQTTPILDELRVIVEQGSEGMISSIVEVPILCDWSSWFWNQRDTGEHGIITGVLRGRQAVSKDDIYRSTMLRDDLLEKALDLIQEVPTQTSSDTRGENITVLFVERMAVTSSEGTRTLRTPLLTFYPRLGEASGRRGFLRSSQTTPRVTGYRRYRSYRWRNHSITRNYHPPSEPCLVIDGVEISRVYRLEKDRTYNVLKLISGVDISEKWTSFLSGVKRTLERCEEQESTRMISEFLSNHPISTELWKQMTWTRERMLPDGLSQPAIAELKTVLKENPQLHLDTGNYLFLLLLYMKYQRPAMATEALTHIWSTLKIWQLLQLGFYVDYEHTDTVGRTVFDLAKIWADMLERVNTLQEIPVPKTPNIRYGRVIVVDCEEGGYDYWMVLQKRFRSSETLSGMWRNVNPIEASGRFLWSTNRNDVLGASARHAKDLLEYDDIAVTDSADGSILWIWTGDGWNSIGRIDVVQGGGDEFRWIRGIRVHPSAVIGSMDVALEGRGKPNLSELLVSSLARLQQLVCSSTAIECLLALDAESYVVTLHSAETEETGVSETLVFQRTQDLVDFLRLPLTTGGPIEVDGERSHHYTWNPYTDIQYGDLGIVRPYVERKKPFIASRVSLPETAKELMQSTTITASLKVRHDVHQCPISLGIGDDHAACWILESDDNDALNAISSILGVGLTDTEIGELIKSKEAHLQGTRYELNIEFPDEENYDDRLIFRESRLFARYLGARWIQPFSFLNPDKVECELYKEENLILVRMISSITGDVIYSGPLVYLFRGMEYQEAIEYADEVFVDIISSHYPNENVDDKIASIDEIRNKIRTLIKKYSYN